MKTGELIEILNMPLRDFFGGNKKSKEKCIDSSLMFRDAWLSISFRQVWTNVQQPEGCTEPLQRAFCQFIMGPINQLMRAIMNDDKER